MPLGAAVVFSSIAGRFGNGGQTDYSAANELLAKSVSSFRNARPGTRGIVVDWTAWADIGMASRGSIPKMMELAGIDMLKPADGIPVVRTELEAGTSGEVVIGGALGILMQEWDETGGLDPEGPSSGPSRPDEYASGLDGRFIPVSRSRLRWTRGSSLSSTTTRSAARPCLPGVMGLEGFGEISEALFPDWHVRAIEGVDFLAPFKFYRDEPRTLTLTAQFTTDGNELLARCRLIGTRPILGRDEVKTHFAATVRLAREPVDRHRSEAPLHASDASVADKDIYQVYFHGPAYQVLDTAWRDNGVVVGRMREQLPDDRQPADLEMVTEPRLVELCFQTAGVWQIGTTGRMGLPQHIDELECVRSADAVEGRLHAVVSPRDGGKSFDAHVTDEAATSTWYSVDTRRRSSPRTWTQISGSLSARRWTERRWAISTFTRIAIVNRGEPAMRFIIAAREYAQEHREALHTIALYTDPDRRAMFVREADEAYSLGPATFVTKDGHRKSSYLDYDRLERAPRSKHAPKRFGQDGASWLSTQGLQTSANDSGSSSSGRRGT